MVTVCPSQFATRRTLFHVLVGCGLLMLKVSRLKLPVIWLLVSMWLNTLTKSQIWTLLLRSEERFSRNAETDLVCRLLLEKKKRDERFSHLRVNVFADDHAHAVFFRLAFEARREVHVIAHDSPR